MLKELTMDEMMMVDGGLNESIYIAGMVIAQVVKNSNPYVVGATVLAYAVEKVATTPTMLT